ncbi:hypothetical protein [Marinicellulosiphila megalodicopiae]|uniref:hypothetical protein n=1 Tax=Marinicellulosiphila megalodicopiae TaxID=2724896 RepID=UPI003BAF785C
MIRVIFLIVIFLSFSCSDPGNSPKDSMIDNALTADPDDTNTHTTDNTETDTQIDENLFYIELENPNFDESKQISTLLEQPVSSNQLSGVLSKDSLFIRKVMFDYVLDARETVRNFSTVVSSTRVYDNDDVETLEIIENCMYGGTIYIRRIGKTFYEMIATDCVAYNTTYNFHAIDYIDDKTVMTFNFSDGNYTFKGNYVKTDNAEVGLYEKHEFFAEFSGSFEATYFAAGAVNISESYSIFGALDTYSHYKYKLEPNAITPCLIERLGVEETVEGKTEELISTQDKCLNPDNFIELPFSNQGDTLVYELSISPSDKNLIDYQDIKFYTRGAQKKGGNEILLAFADTENNIKYFDYSPSKHDITATYTSDFYYTFNTLVLNNSTNEVVSYYLYLNNYAGNWNTELSDSILVDYHKDFNNRLTLRKIGTISNGSFITPYSMQKLNMDNSLDENTYSDPINISEAGYYFIRLEHDYLADEFSSFFDLTDDNQTITPTPIGSTDLYNLFHYDNIDYSADSFYGPLYAVYYLEPGNYELESTFRNWMYGNSIQEIPEIDYTIIIDKIEIDSGNILLE